RVEVTSQGAATRPYPIEQELPASDRALHPALWRLVPQTAAVDEHLAPHPFPEGLPVCLPIHVVVRHENRHVRSLEDVRQFPRDEKAALAAHVRVVDPDV